MLKSILSTFHKTFFTLIFILPGLAIVGYVVYTTYHFETTTTKFTKARINFLEANDKDSTGKTVLYNLIDVNGKETVIIDKEPDSDEGTPLFDERRVRFNAANPTKVYFESSWFGKSIVFVFGGIFIIIGLCGLTSTNVLKKPKYLIIPIIASALILSGVGLILDYVVSLEKDNVERFKYEYVAYILLIISVGLWYYWFWLQKMWNEIDIKGKELKINDFTLEINTSIAAWYTYYKTELNANNEITLENTTNGMPVNVEIKKQSLNSLSINPYIIVCKYEDENKKVHLFKSDLIWFNPTPFIKSAIKITVHPNSLKFYKVDTSFLPTVDLGISRISYTYY